MLDTSALIYDPVAYKHFPDSEVIIPIAVLSELDKLKKQAGEVGKNARVAIKMLEDISQKGDISTGIELEDQIETQLTTWVSVIQIMATLIS